MFQCLGFSFETTPQAPPAKAAHSGESNGASNPSPRVVACLLPKAKYVLLSSGMILTIESFLECPLAPTGFSCFGKVSNQRSLQPFAAREEAAVPF